MQPLQGIHHITAFAKDPQANVDFYHRVLGQRLVKTTVNFDDPGTYHFYFADRLGTPGTVMTFFPWPRAARGRRGNGEVAATAYTVRPESVAFWRRRLDEHGVGALDEEERFGERVLRFTDPDGTTLELVASEAPATIQVQEAGPVPLEHELRGFYGATLWLDQVEPTAAVLTGAMGFRFVAREGARHRLAAAGGDVGAVIDLVERPGEPQARFGAGSVHHIAFRTVDDTEQAEYRVALAQAGLNVTPVQDRQYFHSIYFREPGGVLFEVATDAPGFLSDEPAESLGTTLKLPAWYEPRRAEIERILPRFHHPDTGRELPSGT
jgi:glyoxalase family protein